LNLGGDMCATVLADAVGVIRLSPNQRVAAADMEGRLAGRVVAPRLRMQVPDAVPWRADEYVPRC